MSHRTKDTYNEVIGVTEEGEIYLLNYIFKGDMHGKPFNGATFSVLVPITQPEIDERNDLENVKDTYGYLWGEAASSDQTELSLDDYIQAMIDEELDYNGKHFFGQDDSDIYLIPDDLNKKIEELFDFKYEIVTYECIGGGRSFHHDIKWKEVLRPDLLKLVEEVEPRQPNLKAVN